MDERNTVSLRPVHGRPTTVRRVGGQPIDGAEGRICGALLDGRGCQSVADANLHSPVSLARTEVGTQARNVREHATLALRSIWSIREPERGRLGMGMTNQWLQQPERADSRYGCHRKDPVKLQILMEKPTRGRLGPRRANQIHSRIP